MKLVKMSLAAAVLLGASAFAIDNIKVSGDAKLFYNTNDITTTNAVTGNTDDSLFSKGTSAADAALRVGVTGDLLKGVSFGMTGYAISTLGLENNLVDATWTGAHDARTGTGAGYAEVDDQAWMGEMWVAATLGKTTAKLGRMELDTPFAFSEKWSIVPNTFDAAVLINQDIPDTTLVGAWVGKGNGTNAVGGLGLGTNNTSTLDSVGLAFDGGVVGAGAN
ncbi:MAG: major outer membrane protein, partial [Sulfuricurvum sp.]|nr:major outer membrane protein [Sulfuricurvum sp.]